ncbi:diacylglycerol/lipid kinase family protein [Paracoccus cavernae]|uniref:diacylglycerol/lipid kinase family protein n=1 Tax=Paracoccus cavernae TaxID=1571207 RepID=UPI0035F3643C
MTGSDRRLDLSGKRLVVIVNRKSGKRDGPSAEQVLREKLAPKVGSFDLRIIDKGRDITRTAQAAVRDGADIVAVLGGDGTQTAVAGVLAGTDVAMAVLPTGTFNYFAREIGVGESWGEALEALLDGELAKVSVGEVNGRVFLNNTSFGAYPEILEKRESHYKRWGRSRIGAYWAVLVAIKDLRRPMHLEVTVDGESRSYDTALAFVAKNALQLETLGLDGGEAVRAGHFALFVAHAQKPLALVGAALRLALGRVAHGRDFDMVISDEIEIAPRPSRRLVAYDGEKARMRGPFHLRVRPESLLVVVPRKVGAAEGRSS